MSQIIKKEIKMKKSLLLMLLALVGFYPSGRADSLKYDGSGMPFDEATRISRVVRKDDSCVNQTRSGAAVRNPVKRLGVASPAAVASTDSKLAKKVLIWRPSIGISHAEAPVCASLLKEAYAEKIPSAEYFGSKYPDGIGVDILTGQKSGDRADLPSSLDEYALVFVIFPAEIITSAQVKKLKTVVARGGRVVFQAEHGIYSPTENRVLTQLAKDMGADFEITSGFLGGGATRDLDVDIFNRDSDLLKEDLMNHEYPRSVCVAPIRYSGLAQEVARMYFVNVSNYAVWAVDEASGNGRITAFSDVNWYIDDTTTSYEVKAGSIPFLERLLDNAIENEKKVIDEENPNADIEEKIPDGMVAAVRDKNSFLTYYSNVVSACTAASQGLAVSNRLTVVLKKDIVENFELPEGVTFETTGVTTNYAGSISVPSRCELVVNATHDVYKSVSVHPPETPKVWATKGDYMDKVVISWEPPETQKPITAYEVKRVKVGSTLETVLSSAVTGTSYSDTSARSGVHYIYYVRAQSSAGWGFAGSVEGWSNASGSVPDPVLAVEATAGTETNGVTVTWQADTNAAIEVTHYEVRRAPKGTDDWTTITSSVDPSATSYTDTGADGGVEYDYEVRAGNGNGWSAGVRSDEPGWRKPSLAVSPALVELGPGPGSSDVAVASNGPWSVSPGETWLSGERNPGGLRISVPENPEFAARTGTVYVIAGSAGHLLSNAVLVVQAACPRRPMTLTVSGPDALVVGTTNAYVATVTYNDGSTVNKSIEATWSATPDGFAASVVKGDTNVTLKVGAVLAGSLTLRAEYVETCAAAGGLVAWYKLDGNGRDSSVYGNHAVEHGVVPTTDRNGKANGAYYFNGSTYLEAPDHYALYSVTNHISVCAWMKPSGMSGWQYALCKSTVHEIRQYGLGVNGSRFYINDGEAAVYRPYGDLGPLWTDVSATLVAGEWHHVMVTYDGNVVKAYLDAKLVGSKPVTGYFHDAPGGLLLGYDPPGEIEYYTGALDDVRIYNRALTPEQVGVVYTGGAVADSGTEKVTVVGTKTVTVALPPKLTGLEIESGPTTLEGGSNGTFKVVATFEDGSKRDVTAEATWTVDPSYGTVDAGNLTTYETTDTNRTATVSATYVYTLNGTTTLTATKDVDITFTTRLKRPASISISGPETVGVAETGVYRATVRYNNGDEADVTLATNAVWSVEPARPSADLAKGGADFRLTPYVGGTNVLVSVVYAETCGKTPSGTETVTVETELTVTVPEPISLPDAVDAESLVFAAGASPSGTVWYGQAKVFRNDDDAAQSGHVFGAGESWMETTVTNAGDVSFWWKTSCEPTYDGLTFAVDGGVRAQASGTSNGWQKLSFEIPGGTHTLRWTYAKDGRNDVGEDCGWVDQLVWNPLPAPSATTGGVACASIGASDGTSADFIEVEWSPFDSRRPVLEYELSRAEKGTSDWTVLSTSGALRFVDASAEPGVDYTYRVRARNDAGWGEWVSDDGWRAYSLSVGTTEVEVGCGATTNDLPVSANVDWEIASAGDAWLTAERATATNATLAVGANDSLDARTGAVTVSVGGASPHATNVTVAVVQAGRPPVVDVGFVKPDENWRTRLQVATNTVADGEYAPVSAFTAVDPLDISFGWTNRSEVTVTMPSVRFRLYVPDVDEPVSEWTVEGRAGEELGLEQGAWSGHWPFEVLKALKPGDYRLEAELGPELNDANREGDVDSDMNDNIAIFRFAVRNPGLTLADDVFGGEGWTKLEVMPGNDFAQVPHAAERTVGDGAVAHSAPAVQFGPYVPMNGVKVSGSVGRKALDLVLLIDYSASMRAGIAGLVKNISVMIDQLLKGDANNDPVSDLRIKVVGFCDYKDYDFYGSGYTRPWFKEYAFSTDPDALKQELAVLRDGVSGGSANDGESSFDALYYICQGWTQNVSSGKPTGYKPTAYGFREPDEATRVALIFTDEPPHVDPFLDRNNRECNAPGCEGLTLEAMDSVLKEAGVHLMIVGDGLYQGDMGTYTNGYKYGELVKMDPDTRALVEPEPEDRYTGALAKMTADADFIRNLAGKVSSRVVEKVTKVEPSLSVNVKGSGVLTFKWCNKSTAGEKNAFSFVCDGGVTNLVNEAGSGWKTERLRLEGGSHTFRWSYGKDDYEGAVSDCGLVGDIVWEADRTQLSIDPKFFSVDHPGSWTEHKEDSANVMSVGEGDQTVRVTCNSTWSVVTNGVPDWITFVTREGVDDGEILFQVATNETHELRRATVVVRADECALDATNAYVEQVFRVEQKPSPYVEDGTIQLLTVGVKPRWPWNDKIDIDFRVVTPKKTGTPVKITFTGVNMEGCEMFDYFPAVKEASEVSPYDIPEKPQLTNAHGLSGGPTYVVCETSGLYRVTWNDMAESWYKRWSYIGNYVGWKQEGFHTPAFSVRLTATCAGNAQVVLPSVPVRVDMRQSDTAPTNAPSAFSGGAILTGIEKIGHPTGKVDPVAVDTTDIAIFPSNGWNRLDSLVGDLGGEIYSNRLDRACVINDVYVEGGMIMTDTVWRADKVHVVRDNVFVHKDAVLTIEDGAVVKFCFNTYMYIYKNPEREGKSDEFNLRIKGAYLTCGFDGGSYGGDVLHQIDAGISAESIWTSWSVFPIRSNSTSGKGLVPQLSTESNTARAIRNIALQFRQYKTTPVSYKVRYYSRGEQWGNLPRPCDDGYEFYGWYVNDPGGWLTSDILAEEYPSSRIHMINPDGQPYTTDSEAIVSQIYGLACPKGWAKTVWDPIDASEGHITLSEPTVVYDGAPHSPAIMRLVVNDAVIATNNYLMHPANVAYTNVGSHSVGVVFKTHDYVNSPQMEFTIEPRSIEGGEILFSNPTNGVMYLPGLKKPTVTVRLPDYKGSAIDDAIATRDAKIANVESTDPDDHVWPEVGEYRVVASYEGNPNYTGGALTNIFRVSVNPKYVFTEFASLADAEKDAETNEMFAATTPRIIRFSGRESDILLDSWKDLIRGNTKLNNFVCENFVCWADTTNAAPSIGVRSLKDDQRDIVTVDGVMTVAELLKFFQDALDAPELPTDASGAALTLSGVTLAYDGTVRRPSVTVTLGGETIASGDYDLVWSGDGIDVGEYSVSAVFNGKSYMGETASVAYEVVPGALTASDVSFDPESAVYDGAMHKPSVGTGGIPCAVDYGTGDFAAVGDYPITATASGNYTGTVTKVFRILPEKVDGGAVTVELDALSAEVKKSKSGTDVDVCPHLLSVSDGKRTYVEGVDYDLSYSPSSKFTEPGTYTITVTFKGGYSGSASVEFVVAAAAETTVTVPGDEKAVVEEDDEHNITVKPSEGKKDVVVDIPTDVDASKVTVEVTTAVETVKSKGANVVVRSKGTDPKTGKAYDYDITKHLDIPKPVDGIIDLTKATVKEAVVKAILDPDEGAKVELNAENPSITTSMTRPGLLYTFREGTSLEGFGTKTPSETKIGDGEAWTPTINVKGGTSGFYMIGVEK